MSNQQHTDDNNNNNMEDDDDMVEDDEEEMAVQTINSHNRMTNSIGGLMNNEDDDDNPYSSMSFNTAHSVTPTNRMNLLYSDSNVNNNIDYGQQRLQQHHIPQSSTDPSRMNLLYSDNNVVLNRSINSNDGSLLSSSSSSSLPSLASSLNNSGYRNIMYSDSNIGISNEYIQNTYNYSTSSSTTNNNNNNNNNGNTNTTNDQSSYSRYQLLYSDNHIGNQSYYDQQHQQQQLYLQHIQQQQQQQQQQPQQKSKLRVKNNSNNDVEMDDIDVTKISPETKHAKSPSPTNSTSSSSNSDQTLTSPPQGITSPSTTSTTTNVKPKYELPYNINTLEWDIDHIENKQHIYCYCGKDKDHNMIRCDHCLQRFHVGCIKILDGSGQIPGDWVYRFGCSICTKGNESFERFSKNWVDILEIVLYNLERDHPNQTYFSLDNEIQPNIEENWNLLCSDKKKKANWQKQLPTALANGRIFKSGATNLKKPGYWALGMKQLLLKDNPIFKDKVLAPLHKKKKKKKSSQEEIRFKHITKLLLIPLKENNFVPTVEYDILCVAQQNSAPQITIESDGLTIKNMSGYRMAKASFPCVVGQWYYEIEILNNVGNSRLGWSTIRGDKQANVGYDQFSYCYRNAQGDIFHQGKGKAYGEPYTAGDVIGFYISLPSIPQQQKKYNGSFKSMDQIAIYEMVSDELENENPQPVEGSEIRFFKNGVSPGVAFTNLGGGMYYPAASLYMGAAVRFNFGPSFKYPPQGLPTYSPLSFIVSES